MKREEGREEKKEEERERENNSLNTDKVLRTGILKIQHSV
jgi:hypothetical protein